jgi:PIN domain nuclease of toxin-antitoxin system
MTEEPEGLLDTHILVWARLSPGELTRKQRDFLSDIQARESRVAISAITLWEIAMMTAKNNLKTKASLPSLLHEIETSPWLQVLPINAAVAAESIVVRPSLQTDPADWMIVATARVFRLPLLTSDKRIIKSNLAVIV